MAEYMHLIGTEQVQSAANRMVEAADRMSRAANTISSALQNHENNICEALHIHGLIMIEVMKELNKLEMEGMKYGNTKDNK
jgi:hypothetical protein